MAEFAFLDDDSLEFLESDYQARVSYLDTLSLIHDLLVPFASESERPRFRAQKIHEELANLVHAFGSTRQIGVAARTNIATAEDLRSKAERTRSAAGKAKPAALRGTVDSFIADLLKQYDVIRVIRSRGGAVTRI